MYATSNEINEKKIQKNILVSHVIKYVLISLQYWALVCVELFAMQRVYQERCVFLLRRCCRNLSCPNWAAWSAASAASRSESAVSLLKYTKLSSLDTSNYGKDWRDKTNHCVGGRKIKTQKYVTCTLSYPITKVRSRCNEMWKGNQGAHLHRWWTCVYRETRGT